MNDQNLYDARPEEGSASSATVLDLPVAAAAPAPEPAVETAAAPATAGTAKGRPGWLAPVAIGVAGLVVAGTLGGLLYVNSGQRDLARHQLAATTATLATTKNSLADTQQKLTTAESDAAARAIVEKYVAMDALDGATLQLDAASLQFNCSDPNFNEVLCRLSMQNYQTDVQKFQADRSAAQVPNQFANADSQLKDALSAGIAAIQTLITGWDGNNESQQKDGYGKVHAANLAIAKAELALGTALK